MYLENPKKSMEVRQTVRGVRTIAGYEVNIKTNSFQAKKNKKLQKMKNPFMIGKNDRYKLNNI